MSHELLANELCLLRGDRCLFQGLDFSISSGELLVVEGPNGSGKTSLLRGIAGLTSFETGDVRWNNVPVLKQHQHFRRQLTWMSHRTGFKGDLSVDENLRFEAGLRHFDSKCVETVIARLELTAQRSLPFRVLSAGQQRRTALARQLLSTAPLWIMDEPFTNLDKAGQHLVSTVIEEHLSAGGLCIVASHQAVNVAGTIRRVSLQ